MPQTPDNLPAKLQLISQYIFDVPTPDNIPAKLQLISQYIFDVPNPTTPNKVPSKPRTNFRNHPPKKQRSKKKIRAFSCLSMFKKQKKQRSAFPFRVFRQATDKKKHSCFSCLSMFKKIKPFDVPTPTPTRFRAKQETIFANFRPFRKFSQSKTQRNSEAHFNFRIFRQAIDKKKLFVFFRVFRCL